MCFAARAVPWLGDQHARCATHFADMHRQLFYVDNHRLVSRVERKKPEAEAAPFLSRKKCACLDAPRVRPRLQLFQQHFEQCYPARPSTRVALRVDQGIFRFDVGQTHSGFQMLSKKRSNRSRSIDRCSKVHSLLYPIFSSRR